MILLCSLVFVIEREVSERKSGEEDAMGFFEGTKQLCFLLCSPLLSLTGRGRGGAGR